MRTEWFQDPRELARQLHERYVGQECVVNLRRRADKVGQTVMRVERVYVDDLTPTTRTLRLVGHLPGGDEHGSVALPLDGPTWAILGDAGERSQVIQGEYQLNVVPIE